MMSKFSKNLNGWQRLYLFLVLFLYLPVAIIAAMDVAPKYESKYTDLQVNKQIEKFISENSFSFSLKVAAVNVFDQFDYKSAPLAAPLIDYKNSRASMLVEFNSENGRKYTATFSTSKADILLDDKDILKTSAFVQKLINENTIKDLTYLDYIKILLYFSAISSITYFFGFMIGWVVKGFQLKSEGN